jgi:hypothetical protein
MSPKLTILLYLGLNFEWNILYIITRKHFCAMSHLLQNRQRLISASCEVDLNIGPIQTEMKGV